MNVEETVEQGAALLRRPSLIVTQTRNNLRLKSLKESRINRGGLPRGHRAPSFCLPEISKFCTEKQFSSDFLRGKYVLLVFSDPQCGPCNELLAQLEALQRRTPDVRVVMISRGSSEENQLKVAQNDLTFLVLLQTCWEISTLFEIFVTPAAFLIDPSGYIANEVAIGPPAILSLLRAAAIRCLLSDGV